jgi:hypothetical protein
MKTTSENGFLPAVPELGPPIPFHRHFLIETAGKKLPPA